LVTNATSHWLPLRHRNRNDQYIIPGYPAGRLQWSLRLNELLKAAGESAARAKTCNKSAPWKAAIAYELRRTTTASNDWISRMLHMGTASSVSRWVGAHRTKFKK
jgi:hypothetical protein